MARTDSDSDDRGNGDMAIARTFKRLTGRDLWVVLLAGALAGGSGGTLFGRPDPFTGAQGKELERRINELEHSQALDDEHRKDAANGYQRIRECEQDIARLNAQVDQCRENMRAVRGELDH